MELALFPADVLCRRAALVPDPTSVAVHAAEMARLIAEHDGIGLAAPQIGLGLRFFVLAIAAADPRVFVNLQIVAHSSRAIQHEEDHLNGVLCIDRVDPKRRERIVRRMEAGKGWN